MEKSKAQKNLEEVYAVFKFDTYIALGGMIIPSLRCVAINWEPAQPKANLVFFHDGPVHESLEWHYNCIEVDATCGEEPKYFGVPIMMQIDKVVSCPYPKSLPKVSEVVYLRKEPLTNFNEINHYIPPWHVSSIIRLKVNEALRGKVTGDLRQIHLTWDETEALITFYHNQEITEDIQQHYQEIFNIATATASQWQKERKSVIPKLAIKYVPYPEEIETPDNLDRLYSRKEPFTDKPIGEDID